MVSVRSYPSLTLNMGHSESRRKMVTGSRDDLVTAALLQPRRAFQVQIDRVEVAQFGQLLPIEHHEFAIAEFHRPGAAQCLQRTVHGHNRHPERLADLALMH